MRDEEGLGKIEALIRGHFALGGTLINEETLLLAKYLRSKRI